MALAAGAGAVIAEQVCGQRLVAEAPLAVMMKVTVREVEAGGGPPASSCSADVVARGGASRGDRSDDGRAGAGISGSGG